MKKLISDPALDSYVSPSAIVQSMHCEGILCTSVTHDPFTEDDSWIDFIEQA